MGGESVMRIRERGSEWDLDILRVGFWRDMTRLKGAGQLSQLDGEALGCEEIHIRWSGGARGGDRRRGCNS